MRIYTICIKDIKDTSWIPECIPKRENKISMHFLSMSYRNVALIRCATSTVTLQLNLNVRPTLLIPKLIAAYQEIFSKWRSSL